MDYFDSKDLTPYEINMQAQRCLSEHRMKNLIEVRLAVAHPLLNRLLLIGKVSKLTDTWMEFRIVETRLSSTSGIGGIGGPIDSEHGIVHRFNYTDIEEIEVRLRSMCIIMKDRLDAVVSRGIND